MLSKYVKIFKKAPPVAYYVTHEWKYTNGNVQGMWSRLDPRDQQIFLFSMRTIEWKEYFKTYLKGIRVYLLKDNPDDFVKSKILRTMEHQHYDSQKVHLLAALADLRTFVHENLIINIDIILMF